MIKKIINYIKNKKIRFKNCDIDFWDNIYVEDFEEVDNNVRYSFGLYEPIN